MALFLEQVIGFWSRLPVRYRGAIVVVLPAACALITVIAWGWSRQSSLSIHQRMAHTQAVIDAGDSLLIELLNAETSVRGYVITRDRQFLTPYRQATASVPDAVARLDQLLQPDSPPDLADWQALKQKVDQRLDLLEQVQRAIAAQPPAAPLSPSALALIERSKTEMDQVRSAIAALQAQEQALLADYMQRNTAIERTNNRMLWLALGVSLLSSVAALYLFGHLERELQKREQRLQEARLLLQAIVSSVVDGVLVLDRRGRIELFNATAAEMFGYEPSEVIGRDLGLLLAAADRQTPAAGPTPAFLKPYGIQLGRPWQTQGIRKGNTRFPIEISISDVPVEQRLIAIIRDISEYQQTQAKLETRASELARLGAILAKTNATLEERNRELEQFAYVASHDLKAPLRAIANLSEWIEEDLADRLPPENQQQMTLLRGRVHRMEALINGLLEYSRVGRTQAAAEPVEVAALIADVVDSLAPPVSFTIAIASDLPTLTTKRLLLRQVFANLIGNAIKHHDRPTGQITITARDLETAYEFAVADDGPGIPPEYHDKIFVIFQTLQARDTKESTGIGLSIVKKIVETEGGTVRVESGPDRGTVFYFTWLK